MLREVLYAKIHGATVTACNPEYIGSITIDRDLLDVCGMVVNEKVLVADVTNGQRLTTYIFEGNRGSGKIEINGAAANLSGIGHTVLIMSFCHVTEEELREHRPRVVFCHPDNSVAETIQYPAASDQSVAE